MLDVALPHSDLDPEEMNEDQWRESFVAAMLAQAIHEPEDAPSLRKYAAMAADTYFLDRERYDDAREAVRSDISCWGD